MGGQSGGSTTKQEIPKELRPLYSQTGTKVQELQNQAPLSDFTKANPMRIAGASNIQDLAFTNLAGSLRDANQPLESGPTIQAGSRYFDSVIAPKIEADATLAGLGRSTALTNAKATTEAQTLLPLLQAEQARRDALIPVGASIGAQQRGIEQDTNTAEYQDFLRRQGLSEQALFGPLGQLPSTIGQSTKSSSQSGLFK